MKNEKARILTFHFVSNYGAVLQTLALSKVLERYYTSVEVLNYRPKYMLNEEKNINTNSVKATIDSIYSMHSFKSRKKFFENFRKKYLRETKEYLSNEEIDNLEEYDLYVGSDQVWNLDIIGEDNTYFAEFINTKPQNTFAYAASIGTSNLTNEKKEKISKLISNFDNISLREESAAKLLGECNTKELPVVLDPTLLLSKDEWKEIFKINQNLNKKYIFLYSLTANPETLKYAQFISEELKLPIIEVSGKRKTLKRFVKHKIFYDASPDLFVELLANSEIVITDSFHATTFSIIFEKNFITTIHKTRGDRIKDFLTKVNLLEHYTNEIDRTLIHEIVDYKKIKEKMLKYRQESINYIERCINMKKG